MERTGKSHQKLLQRNCLFAKLFAIYKLADMDTTENKTSQILVNSILCVSGNSAKPVFFEQGILIL